MSHALKLQTNSTISHFLEPEIRISMNQAKLTQELRKMRSKNISAEYLKEPGWDMMLELFVQKCRGKAISINSLCHASGAAMTTALRWIGTLENNGDATSRMSCEDGRVRLVEMTQDAFERMKHTMLMQHYRTIQIANENR